MGIGKNIWHTWFSHLNQRVNAKEAQDFQYLNNLNVKKTVDYNLSTLSVS